MIEFYGRYPRLRLMRADAVENDSRRKGFQRHRTIGYRRGQRQRSNLAVGVSRQIGRMRITGMAVGYFDSAAILPAAHQKLDRAGKVNHHRRRVLAGLPSERAEPL